MAKKLSFSRVALLFVVAVTAGCSMSEPMERAPASRAVAEQESWGESAPARAKGGVTPGATAPAHRGEMLALVLLDVGTRTLGSYEIAIEYDPQVLSIEAVYTPSGRGAFPASPIADPGTFSSGRTSLLGFTVAAPFPTGRVVVAQLALVSRTPARVAVSVSVKSLYDAKGNPIPGTASVEYRNAGIR